MTSQDDLALLKQMYQRGEISDEQYDVLRRHVLWGTPLPQRVEDIPAPRPDPTPPQPPTQYRRPGYPDPGPAYAPADRGRYADRPAPADPPAYAPADRGRYADRPAPADPGRYAPSRPTSHRARDAGPPDPRDAAPDPTSVSTGRHAPAPADPPDERYGSTPAGQPPDRYAAGARDPETPSPPRPAPGAGAHRHAAPDRPRSRRARRKAAQAQAAEAETPDPAASLPPAGHRTATGGPDPAPPSRYAPSAGGPDLAAVAYRPPTRAYPPRSRPDDAADAGGRDGGGAADEAAVAYRPPTRAYPRRSGRGEEERPDRAADDPRRTRTGTAAEKEPRRPRTRPRRRSLIAVLTSLVLALALVAAGVWWFALREAGVLPADYARSVCASVRDWQQAVDSSGGALVTSIAREKDRTTVRTAVTTYYTTVAGRTDQLRTTILDAGAPDVAGGQAYTDSLAATVGDQATALRGLAARAGRLDPAAATFQVQLQGLLTGSDTAVSAVSSALARPSAGTPTGLRTALSNEPACAPYVG